MDLSLFTLPIGKIVISLLLETNGMKNTPDGIEWCNENFTSSSTHAEMNVIKNFLNNKRMYSRRKKHFHIYNYNIPKKITVIRLYKGKLRNSRPCDACIKIMRLYGIRKVIYSSGDNERPYYSEYVETMELLGDSRGNR